MVGWFISMPCLQKISQKIFWKLILSIIREGFLVIQTDILKYLHPKTEPLTAGKGRDIGAPSGVTDPSAHDQSGARAKKQN